MGDKGQKNKDKHNKQVDIAKNEAETGNKHNTIKEAIEYWPALTSTFCPHNIIPV